MSDTTHKTVTCDGVAYRMTDTAGEYTCPTCGRVNCFDLLLTGSGEPLPCPCGEFTLTARGDALDDIALHVERIRSMTKPYAKR